MAIDSSQADPASPQGNGKRRRVLLIVGLLAAVAVVAYGIEWLLVGRFHESTDDAYVGGNIVQVTPQVAGTVISIAADDTDLVREGDALVLLDPTDANVALERAKSDLAQAVRQVRAIFASTGQGLATVKLREVELTRAQTDLERREGLDEPGAVSAEDIRHAHESVASAQAALTSAKEQLQTTIAFVDNTTITTHPMVQSSIAKFRDAYLSLHRATIPSPITGHVAKRNVQVGQRVSPGTPLLAIIPLREVWVDANFKEVQLPRIRIGQPVTLTADSYGDNIEYHGHVMGLSAGTGSAFALLPAQNATGNWVKVVQRLPVRITLDPKELDVHPLRVGLSMQVDVDVHSDEGPMVASEPRKAPAFTTSVYGKSSGEVDAIIENIIRENLEHPPVAKTAAAHISKARTSLSARR